MKEVYVLKKLVFPLNIVEILHNLQIAVLSKCYTEYRLGLKNTQTEVYERSTKSAFLLIARL